LKREPSRQALRTENRWSSSAVLVVMRTEFPVTQIRLQEVSEMFDDGFDGFGGFGGFDNAYDTGCIGGYDSLGLFETPDATYDTYGDQVAVDGYQDGVLSESQMADEFSQDASFDSFDNIIND
jgi:hypothetical protein